MSYIILYCIIYIEFSLTSHRDSEGHGRTNLRPYCNMGHNLYGRVIQFYTLVALYPEGSSLLLISVTS